MAARWQKDAAQEEADPRIVSTVILLMERYQGGTLEVRLVCADSIRKSLAGEVVEIEDEAPAVEQEAPASPPPPSRAERRRGNNVVSAADEGEGEKIEPAQPPSGKSSK